MAAVSVLACGTIRHTDSGLTRVDSKYIRPDGRRVHSIAISRRDVPVRVVMDNGSHG